MVDIRSELERQVNSAIGDDGVHPNDYGHQIIASRVIQELKTLDPTLVIRIFSANELSRDFARK